MAARFLMFTVVVMRRSWSSSAASTMFLPAIKGRIHHNAAPTGWINGYGDGSFHADREINRAEVVTIVNRSLKPGEADEDYIADNLRKRTPRWEPYIVQPPRKQHYPHRRAGRERKLEQVTIPAGGLRADHPHFLTKPNH